MLDKIESLRKEPVHVRNRYAFWVAFCVTLIIAIIWGISLPSRLAQEQVPLEQEPEVVEDVSRLGELLTNAGNRFAEIIQSFRSTPVADTQATTTKEQIDFAELIASSTERKRNTQMASSTASSTDGVSTSTMASTTTATTSSAE